MYLLYIIHHKIQKKNVHTCIGPGMQDRTLSMFSEVTSTSFTATRTSPENRVTIGIGVWISSNPKDLELEH